MFCVRRLKLFVTVGFTLFTDRSENKKAKNNEFAEPGDTIVVPRKNMFGK